MPNATVGDRRVGSCELQQGYLALAEGQSGHGRQGAGEAKIASFLHQSIKPYPLGQPQRCSVATASKGRYQAQIATTTAAKALTAPAQWRAADWITGLTAPLESDQIGNQLEGAAGLAQGHRGPIELALAVVATAGKGKDAAGARIEHHHGPFPHPQRLAVAKSLAQQPFHLLLQVAIQIGIDQEIALGRHLCPHQLIEVAAHLI